MGFKRGLASGRRREIRASLPNLRIIYDRDVTWPGNGSRELHASSAMANGNPLRAGFNAAWAGQLYHERKYWAEIIPAKGCFCIWYAYSFVVLLSNFCCLFKLIHFCSVRFCVSALHSAGSFLCVFPFFLTCDMMHCCLLIAKENKSVTLRLLYRRFVWYSTFQNRSVPA